LSESEKVHICEFIPPHGGHFKYLHFPSGARREGVIFLHGIQSHSGWYTASAAYLQKAGFDVFSLDRRGSGLNTEDRGHIDDWDILVRDIACFIEEKRLQGQGEKFHLVGISWGGKLATAFAILHPEHLRSLVLLAPGISPKVGLNPLQSLSVFLNSILNPKRAFPIPIDRPEMFTANPDRIRFIRDDALSLHKCSARFMFESFKMDRFLRRNRTRLTVPTLLLLAGRDRIADNSGLEKFFLGLAGTERRVRLFPDACHTLEFEQNPEPIFREILRWIEKHSKEVSLTGNGARLKSQARSSDTTRDSR